MPAIAWAEFMEDAKAVWGLNKPRWFHPRFQSRMGLLCFVPTIITIGLLIFYSEPYTGYNFVPMQTNATLLEEFNHGNGCAQNKAPALTAVLDRTYHCDTNSTPFNMNSDSADWN